MKHKAVVLLLSLALLAFAVAVAREAVEESPIEVRVDPRVELMSIIFRLAGSTEYNHPGSRSAYADEVAEHFGKFKDHPVVLTARELRSKRGVSYDAVISIALHVTDAVELKERVPFDKTPRSLESRWRPAEARDFLVKARQFAKDTGFPAFVASHKQLYEETAARMRKTLQEHARLDWFDSFYGSRPGARFVAMPGMLTGPNCYGCTVKLENGTEEISAVIGASEWDSEGVPAFREWIVATVVHELSHSYVNPIVYKHAAELKDAGERIYRTCERTMKSQAYSNWTTMMHESLVRAACVRYALATEGEAAAEKAIKSEHGRGFRWVGDLSKLLEEYECDRRAYPTLESFMPQIAAFFNAYADSLKDITTGPPQVVSTVPADGAAGVAPNLKAIVVTFDRPMMKGSFSVCGDPKEMPESVGKPSYDREGKVLTIRVRLEPNRTYRLSLNSPSYRYFRSKQRVELEPYPLTFTTGTGPGQEMTGAPKVVSIVPANGATDVDPNLKAIVVTFDRPMIKGNYSICGGGPDFPEILGKPYYDREGKVLTVRVRLKPNWTYRFSLNCPSYRAFKSVQGVALEPFPVTFTTRGE